MRILSLVHRYVFRGIAIVVVIGVITMLWLAFSMLRQKPAQRPLVHPTKVEEVLRRAA